MTAANNHSQTGQPLEIRGAPQKVRKFNKLALASVLGLGALLVLGSFAIAVRPPTANGNGAPRELYNTASKPTADGLSALPTSYADIKQDTPRLGPALQGDLGPAMRRAQQTQYADPDPLANAPAGGSREAAKREAEMLIRNAQLSDTARTSGVFFQIDASPTRALRPAATAAADERPDPFAYLAALGQQAGSVSEDVFGGDPNAQARKEAFAAREQDDAIYNPYQLQTPASPHQIMAGTIIPATLLTGVNSDLPGQVIAQVSEPVYDTVTGQTLLLPQGARVIGRYDSVIAYGQSRALLIWSRIIMPDGSSIQIDNLPGVDARGFAGLSDRVDHHSWRLARGIALSTLLSVGTELADDDDDRVSRAIRDAVQDGANQAGQKIVQRQLGVQPTLTIRPGWRLGIIVNKDIILRPYQGDTP